MKKKAGKSGYITFTLHSHLPYVVHHGTWPHGLDWLHEAAAETYLPLLRVLGELEQEGIALKANLNLSPILLEQLSHPTFQEEFGKYLQQKIGAAREDALYFKQRGEQHLAEVAEFWMQFFEWAQSDFEELGRDIVRGFRKYYESGAIEIITCGATHGYFALLGTDASIRAQVRMGVETHRRFFGRNPRGIWLPECAYRPAGEWRYPVSLNGAGRPPFARAGVEQILAENGIEYFFVDTHLVETHTTFTPYELLAGGVPVATERNGGHPRASFYHPYFADTPHRRQAHVAFFTRDPRTGVQVWSGEHGYPGDGVYLDFHKKRWPGGHRYWQVTHPKIDLGAKTAYFPEAARAKAAVHAAHFANLAGEVIQRAAAQGKKNEAPPILTAPFDAELFGHWWFEGPEFLKQVARECAKQDSGISLISCGEYLDQFPPKAFVALPEGSWGRNGTHEVWLNPETEWTWKHIYPAELAVQQVVESGAWRATPTATRLAKQLCRELLLLESSDWQFLITTLHARDYAEKRFQTHLDQFRTLLDAMRRFQATGEISGESQHNLRTIEERDSVFPTLQPEMWAEKQLQAASS